MRNVTIPNDLCFILIEDHNTQPLHSGSYWILLMLYNPFQRKGILSIMPAVNVSSNISKRKKLIVEPITPCRNCNYPCLSTLKDSTTPKDHMALLECYHLTRRKNSSGIRSDTSFQKVFSNNCVYLLDYGPYPTQTCPLYCHGHFAYT